jgi:hypothetical protein
VKVRSPAVMLSAEARDLARRTALSDRIDDSPAFDLEIGGSGIYQDTRQISRAGSLRRSVATAVSRPGLLQLALRASALETTTTSRATFHQESS